MSRRALRNGLRAALGADPRMDGYTVPKSWVRSIDPSFLPAVGVFTPQENRQRSAVDQYIRYVDVVVQVRRIATEDLEDLMDDDAELIEAVALPFLEGQTADFELQRLDFEMEGAGEERLGKLNMTFRAHLYTNETT